MINIKRIFWSNNQNQLQKTLICFQSIQPKSKDHLVLLLQALDLVLQLDLLQLQLQLQIQLQFLLLLMFQFSYQHEQHRLLLFIIPLLLVYFPIHCLFFKFPPRASLILPSCLQSFLLQPLVNQIQQSFQSFQRLQAISFL